MMHICLLQPREVAQTEPTRKVEKKKKRRLWTTDANRLQITVNLKKMRHLRRVSAFVRKFTSKLQVLYARKPCVFHNSSKTPDDADIANRKHYSAPAGALTMFFFVCLRSGTVTTLTVSDILVSWCNPSEGAGIYVCVHL